MQEKEKRAPSYIMKNTTAKKLIQGEGACRAHGGELLVPLRDTLVSPTGSVSLETKRLLAERC